MQWRREFEFAYLVVTPLQVHRFGCNSTVFVEDGLEGDGLGFDTFTEREEIGRFDGDVEWFGGALRERAKRTRKFPIDDTELRGMAVDDRIGIDWDDAAGLEECGLRKTLAEHGARGVGVQAEGLVIAVATNEAGEFVCA